MVRKAKRARSWTIKTAVLFITLNISLLLLFGGLVLALSTKVVEGEVESYVDKTMDQAAIIWDNVVLNVYARMLRITTMDAVHSCLKLPQPTRAVTLAYERQIDKIIKDADLFMPMVEDMLILGNNGYVYNLSNGNDLITGYPFTLQPWYAKAIDITDGVYIHLLPLHDQLYYNPRINQPAARAMTFSISMAIAKNHDTVIGAVICTFNLEALGKQLMSSNYEKSGKIALVASDGMIIGQNDNTRIGEPFCTEADLLQDILTADHLRLKRNMNEKSFLLTIRKTNIDSLRLVSYIPVDEIYAHSNTILYTVLPLLGLFLLGNFALAWIISRSVSRPVKQLVQSIANVNESQLTCLPTSYPYWELNTITEKFNTLLAKLDAFIYRDYLSQLQLNRFQLSALQAQIRPHFLFNTLQLLQTEILYQNLDASNDIIVSLSRLLRYTMNNDEAEVMLSQELDYLQDYLSLFVRKYSGKLTIDIQAEDELKNKLLPKLILQPIVENCIKHAFSDDPSTSHIYVHVQRDNGNMLIGVRDDGCGMSSERITKLNRELNQPEIPGDSIGLRNVHQRITKLYSDRYGLEVIGSKQGLLVLLTLPIREKGSVLPSNFSL